MVNAARRNASHLGRPSASCNSPARKWLRARNLWWESLELYEYLEQGKIGYAIRLPANQVIQEQIQLLSRFSAGYCVLCSVFSSVNSAFSATAVRSWYSVFSAVAVRSWYSVFSAVAVRSWYSVLSAVAVRSWYSVLSAVAVRSRYSVSFAFGMALHLPLGFLGDSPASFYSFPPVWQVSLSQTHFRNAAMLGLYA